MIYFNWSSNSVLVFYARKWIYLIWAVSIHTNYHVIDFENINVSFGQSLDLWVSHCYEQNQYA